MPPVEMTEERPEALEAATAAMPWPLCARPLPPMIVTEKGESLADFVRRSAPDFFTSLQVRRRRTTRMCELHVSSSMDPSMALAWYRCHAQSGFFVCVCFTCASRVLPL